MAFTTMTIGDLCVSPYNVRINEADYDQVSIAGMAESLLTRGQLYPLVVHPMPRSGKRKQFGALAGGRRYRAFKLLIEQGRLPADHRIEVIVRDITDEGELRELSLAENLVRRNLRDYEVYAAVARAHTTGRTLRDIADTNGQTIETVRRWARLGNLHERIFAALAAGEISEEQAKAYGATEDRQLQINVFEQIAQSGLSTTAAGIRRMLKVGSSELEKLLRFIGEKAYRDAGGGYELDLFADQAEERGRVEHEGLLMQMVDEKLALARELLRLQVANAAPGRELRFEANPPRNPEYGGIANDLEISPGVAALDPADEERFPVLVDEMAELAAQASAVLSDPALDQAQKDARIVAIDVDYVPREQEMAAIDARRALPLPDGDIFATLEIDEDGDLEQRFWWASRKAKRAADRPATPPRPVAIGPTVKPPTGEPARVLMPKPADDGRAIDSSYGVGVRQAADAAVKDEFGPTAEGVQILRSLRREVLRCGLLDDADRGGTYGRDYATWCLLRFELDGGYGYELGARPLSGGSDSNGSWDAVRPHLKRSIAGGRWEKEIAAMRDHPCMALNDLLAAFKSYHAETSFWKDKAGALLAGLMLERSLNAHGYRVPLHDLLADGVSLCDKSVSIYVEPTEELVDIFPRAQRLSLAKPHVDKPTMTGWAKLKAGDLAAPVARALRRSGSWVHPLMRFERPKPSIEEEAA